MLHLAQAVREQIINETPPRKGEKAKSSTLRALRRIGSWGVVTAGALLVVVLTSRSEVGSQRIAMMLSGGQRQAAAPVAAQPRVAALPQVAASAVDVQTETRKLADAVRSLAADRDQIKSRLAAVEQDVHEMSDVTGSISRQIAATVGVRHGADGGPTAAATAAASVSLAPVATAAPAVSGAPLPSGDFAGPATPPAPAASPPTQYGVDIGSGLTIEQLRARWLSIYTAHPQLFDGMKPIVSVKEVARGNRVELRLVAGPIAQVAAATRLCASLAAFGLFCQPTLRSSIQEILRRSFASYPLSCKADIRYCDYPVGCVPVRDIVQPNPVRHHHE